MRNPFCCGFCCVQVFTNDGQFKMRFGVRGRSPGQLQRPTGVTVDLNGDIIVADYDNRWISIFSSEGKFKVRRTGRNKTRMNRNSNPDSSFLVLVSVPE